MKRNVHRVKFTRCTYFFLDCTSKRLILYEFTPFLSFRALQIIAKYFLDEKFGGIRNKPYLCTIKNKKSVKKHLFWLVWAMGTLLLLIGCQTGADDTGALRPSLRARAILEDVEHRVEAHEVSAADSLLVEEIDFFDQHEMYDELERALLLRADLLLIDGKKTEAATCLLRGVALAEGMGDEPCLDRFCQRLHSDIDTSLNVSLVRELLTTQHQMLRQHSFGDDSFSFWPFCSIALFVLLLGCLFFYKIRLDNELQLEKIKRLREQIAHRDEREIQSMNLLREDEEVKRFRQSLIRQTNITAEDWSSLRQRFTEVCPSFEKKLRDIHALSEVEWQVCMLLKLDFTPSDISVLTSRSQAAISTIRSRLYAKFFLQKGSSADWDRFIASL